MERKRNLIESFERWARKEEVGRIFPREIGIPREIANDEVDYIGYVTGRNRVDCHASVFSNWQIMRREFDTIFLDIDDHVDGLKGAYAKLQEVVDLLDGYEFRCYATGRGFHLYLVFDMTNIEDFGWAVRVWAKEKGILDYVDSAVLGDIRRMARLPETVNSAAGLECVEINVSSDYNSIKEAMKNGISTIVEVGKNSGLGNELLQCEKKHRRGRKKKVRKNYALTFDLKDMPSCMKEGINRLFATGELEHFWRVALAIFLLKVWGFDKTKELFRMAASDFNEGKTDYQLRYIKNRGFYTYSCKKLKMMGICSFSDLKDCPFYLASNGWIENIIKEVKE